MRRIPASLFLPVIGLLLLSFDTNSLIDHPMPVLAGTTLDGKTIDAGYYKGHVTIVSFMYIGCPPCMTEIATLNKIVDDYRGNPQMQVLCVARQMRQQMVDFNSENKSMFSKIRHAFGADSIRYPIFPACPDADSKMVKEEKAPNDTNEHITIKSECGIIEQTYGFTAFPTMFFVDKKGVVRKVQTGAPQSKNDPNFYAEIKKEIDELLAE